MDQMNLRVLAVLFLLELHHFRDFHVHLLVQTIQLHQLGQELLLDRLVQAGRFHPVVRMYRWNRVALIGL